MVTFGIQGMTCGGCARRVGAAIRQIDGQAAVDVDLAAATVSVRSGIDPARLRDAIEQAGFQVRP